MVAITAIPKTATSAIETVLSKIRLISFFIVFIYLPSLSGETAKSDKSSKTSPTPAGEKLYVGSKNGEVYHFPWCSGAQRMKEANKIFFSSREEAEKAGYRPAANCEGL